MFSQQASSEHVHTLQACRWVCICPKQPLPCLPNRWKHHIMVDSGPSRTYPTKSGLTHSESVCGRKLMADLLACVKPTKRELPSGKCKPMPHPASGISTRMPSLLRARCAGVKVLGQLSMSLSCFGYVARSGSHSERGSRWGKMRGLPCFQMDRNHAGHLLLVGCPANFRGFHPSQLERTGNHCNMNKHIPPCKIRMRNKQVVWVSSM